MSTNVFRDSLILAAMVWTVLASISPVLHAADDLTIEVTIDRDTIGMGEQAMLQVVVSGAEQNLPQPRLPTLPMFEIYSQGRASNISIVNGSMSASVTYRYMLLPTKPGTFPIEPIAIVHNNKRHVGNRVELTVLGQGTSVSPRLEDRAVDGSGKSRDYFLEAVVDKNDPYVNEQVTLTLRFYTAVQYYGSPQLNEPATTGFWTEVLGNKAPYYQKLGDRTYKVIERKYALFPTQTGELIIGRASIRFTVARRDRRFRDPFNVFGDFFGSGQEVAVHSLPITLQVKPLPREGRPADFSGTIGDFKISAAADKREVDANQPVTVTIKITGTGNVKSVAEPAIPELDDFRVYRASSSENVSKLNDRLGGSKIFEEVFIPRRPGRLEIPALSFNYFDPQAGKYRSATTRPITINVLKPEGYAASPDIPYTAPDLTISSRARDIRYIKDDMGSPRPLGRILLFTPLYLVINGLPVVVLAVTVLVRRRREKMTADIGYARSRRAGKMARQRLVRAKSMAGVQQAGEFYAEIHTAVTAYIADKFNISPHGLTTDRIAELLRERSADEDLIQDMTDFLQKCDFARFAPASITQSDIDQSLVAAEQIMIRIEGVKLA